MPSTIRTQNSKLWFVNNPKFHEEIVAYLAKYQEVYGVVLYAFVLMGNHYHLIARFPKGNRDKAIGSRTNSNTSEGLSYFAEKEGKGA